MSKVQSAAIAHPENAPFIVQRNCGVVQNDRVARPTFSGQMGRRYEVLERESTQWSLISVLTVIDGGRRR